MSDQDQDAEIPFVGRKGGKLALYDPGRGGVWFIPEHEVTAVETLPSPANGDKAYAVTVFTSKTWFRFVLPSRAAALKFAMSAAGW